MPVYPGARFSDFIPYCHPRKSVLEFRRKHTPTSLLTCFGAILLRKIKPHASDHSNDVLSFPPAPAVKGGLCWLDGHAVSLHKP
jgi:hypothetical protein